MKTRHAILLALVAVLGLSSSAFAAPMLTVDTATGAMTLWGSHAAAAAANPGSGISNPGGEVDTSLTGIQVTDTSALDSSGVDVASLFTPDVITGAFPFVQAQVFLDSNYAASMYYAELLSPASLDGGVSYGVGDSTVLDVASAGGTGVAAEFSYEGGASTVAMDVAYVAIPEPSTLLLICLGLVGLTIGRRSAR